MKDDKRIHRREEVASVEDAPAEEKTPKRGKGDLLSGIFKSESNIRSTARTPDAKVLYPNADVLKRPLDPPTPVRRGIALMFIIAALLGAAFLAWYFDGVVNEPQRQEQAMADNLSQDIAYDLPQLYPLMALDNATILSTFQEAGLSVFEMPTKENSAVWQVIKLPAGVNAAEAGAIYLSGIDKVGAADAARLLNGSWDLKVDRENGVNVVLHFVDFKSKSVDAAVQAAIAAEGLTDSSIEKSGEDESGNTYTMGTITGDTGTYSWRVSAIPLSEIYAINGLPEDAVYVGVRMTS